MNKVKLSKLPNNVMLSAEDSGYTYSVEELKHEIIELGEPHHETTNWYTIKLRKWVPDAETMLERYIEMEYDDMFEDWGELAWNCITDDVIKEIQDILDKTFKNDESVTTYWTYETPVEIDIYPNDKSPAVEDGVEVTFYNSRTGECLFKGKSFRAKSVMRDVDIKDNNIEGD